MQTCDLCVLLQRAFTLHLSVYVLHSSISVKKKKKKEKKRKEKIEKNEKWNLCFIQKSYMYMYMKKSGTLICNFVSCDSRVGPTIQTAIFQFFSLTWQRLSKAYAINCSCFPKGAQNTLYIQKKKERTKINHP